MKVKLFFDSDYTQLETEINNFIDSKVQEGGSANPAQLFKYVNAGTDGLLGTVVYEEPAPEPAPEP